VDHPVADRGQAAPPEALLEERNEALQGAVMVEGTNASREPADVELTGAVRRGEARSRVEPFHLAANVGD